MNSSEAIVYSLLYETLVRLDCEGRVTSGLARKWSHDDGIWTFVLRDGARWSDGSPLTAHDVLDSWGGRFTAEAVSVHELLVETPKDIATFARPEFAVTRDLGATYWPPPLGTGSWERFGTGLDSSVVCGPVEENLSTFVFLLPRAGTARDLLDAGVDAIVVRDRDAREYARTFPEMSERPLPWEDAYVLVSGWLGTETPDSELFVTEWPEESFRQALTRDAVSADARAAEGTTTQPRRRYFSLDFSKLLPRILYPADDPEAKRLAERFVAMAGSSDGYLERQGLAWPAFAPGAPPLVAVGATASDIQSEIYDYGRCAAVLLRLPVGFRVTPDAVGRTNAGYEPEVLGTRPSRPDSLAVRVQVPLIDTRPYWVARETLGGLEIDGFGRVRLHHLGWRDHAP